MNTVRNGFIRPFTEQVWWLTLAVAVLNWLLLWLTTRFEIRLQDHPSTCTLSTHPASETALITTAALCQQGKVSFSPDIYLSIHHPHHGSDANAFDIFLPGLSEGPRLCSGRIVFLSLLMWALLLFQYYSASIVGSLLAEPPRYINTLKDLLESDLAVGIEDIVYNHNFFAVNLMQFQYFDYTNSILPFTRSLLFYE